MCLLKYVLNYEQHFSFFIFRSGLSDMWINCNRIIDGFCIYVGALVSLWLLLFSYLQHNQKNFSCMD
jgi:hypothetical protein